MAVSYNYVKFHRGSSLAFSKLTEKNKDTLYFITDSDSNKSSLYLGDKLIASDVSSFSDLNDILLDNLENNHLLIYDSTNKKWINKSAYDAIGPMFPATDDSQGGSGLVPAPGIGQQNLFLRGDGTWASPSADNIQLLTDNKTIETLEDGATLSLKDFGKKYYIYVPSSGSEENGDFVAAHYTAQNVDAEHPWKEGLEPKVVEENGKLVLGWFEPNQETLEGIADSITNLQGQINDLNDEVQNASNSIITLGATLGDLKTSVTNIENELNGLKTTVDGKADVNSVYTKEETDAKINEAITGLDHLTRKIFNTLDEAQSFASIAENPDSYIYMVKNTDDPLNEKYDEYLWVEDTLNKVGSWDVDLSGYVTETDFFAELTKKVDKKDGYSLVSDLEIAKLLGIEVGAQKNLFDKVNLNEFSIDLDESGESTQLNLKEVSIDKVTNLETVLNSKVDSTVYTNKVKEIEDNIININNSVTDITSQLSNFVLTSTYDADKKVIMDAITWHDLDAE